MVVLVVPASAAHERAARETLPAGTTIEGLSPEAALESLRKRPAALVVVALHGAEGNGFVASLRALAEPPRVIVSADAELDGVDDVLPREPPLLARRLRLAFRLSSAELERDAARELRAALAEARIGVYRVDLMTQRGEWSDVMHEILGHGRDQFNGTIEGGISVLMPEDQQPIRERITRAVREGRSFSVEQQIVQPNGRTVWIQGTGATFRDGAGRPRRMVGTVIDITERKLAELTMRHALEEMRESDERFRVVARATSDAVWDWDFATDVVTWNENLAKFGWDFPSTPLSWWEETMHPDDRHRVSDGLVSAVELGEETWQDEYRFKRGDGTWANVFDRGVVIRDDAGKPVRMIGAMMDISDRRELQARLLLADRMASVGTLAAGVAHEINNPLAYVIANIDIANGELRRLDSPMVTRTLSALAEAKDGAERVRRIVGDLKTFSRADDAIRERVDLRDVVESSINLAMNEVRHRARLTRDLGPVPRVEANAGRLGQVVVNLLVNAAQAIPEGAADRNEIHVCTRSDEQGNAVLEVRDTGPGMPPEIKHRIFDPFYTTKPVGEGTGLGLTICHGIVSELGGSIEVESEVGAGSTFRVVLPRIEPSDRPVPKPSAAPVSTVTRPGRVLVIDDEPMIGRAVQLMLDGVHDVTTMVSARDALARIERDGPWDAIVCDLMMPEMTGMDLHAAIAEKTPRLAERFVFLTGGAFTPRARAFLERSSNPLLEKPFETEALLEAIAVAMRRGR